MNKVPLAPEQVSNLIRVGTVIELRQDSQFVLDTKPTAAGFGFWVFEDTRVERNHLFTRSFSHFVITLPCQGFRRIAVVELRQVVFGLYLRIRFEPNFGEPKNLGNDKVHIPSRSIVWWMMKPIAYR